MTQSSPTLANSYARLPEHFFARLDPAPVASPRLIKFNFALAAELGIDVNNLGGEALANLFSGNGSLLGAEPIAMAYAGHQFGNFVPQLGDGRAILLGEMCDSSGRRRDIQLKGSGRTPFSRGGDGRAALGPVLREYVLSEAMHALGIPATRALAAVMTGEYVIREGRLPGAVLTRVAESHVRVGTFQFFAARDDVQSTRLLADYVIDRHYPEARADPQPYVELLRRVVDRQAFLVARWMQVGFIHGVMNTDNMAVSGQTIDFGPCAFLDAFDPAKVFSSIDRQGRYAYRNQPAAAQWNLARFAETLLPFMVADRTQAVEVATAILTDFSGRFGDYWLSGMRQKIGLFTAEPDDADMVRRLLDVMQEQAADFTLVFRHLAGAAEAGRATPELQGLLADAHALDPWIAAWTVRLARESRSAAAAATAMRAVNPLYIARNHRVEALIVAAVEHADFEPFETLLRVLSQPFDAQPAFDAYSVPPQEHEQVLQTFCGT